MQLKSVAKGRFNKLWQHSDNLIREELQSCVLKKQMFNAEEVLLTQGQAIDNLLLIESGLIYLSYTAQNGRRFQLGTMECDEQLFGEMEFFTGYPCQLDIVAQEPLIAAVISGDKLEQALINYPQLALFFANAIAVDYQDTLEILLQRVLYPISYNIAHDLYLQHLKLFPVGGFDKYYLEAERFATTDRVYRRAVKELIDLDLIERRNNRLEIKDLNKLRQFLDKFE